MPAGQRTWRHRRTPVSRLIVRPAGHLPSARSLATISVATGRGDGYQAHVRRRAGKAMSGGRPWSGATCTSSEARVARWSSSRVVGPNPTIEPSSFRQCSVCDTTTMRGRPPRATASRAPAVAAPDPVRPRARPPGRLVRRSAHRPPVDPLGEQAAPRASAIDAGSTRDSRRAGLTVDHCFLGAGALVTTAGTPDEALPRRRRCRTPPRRRLPCWCWSWRTRRRQRGRRPPHRPRADR